MLAADGTSTAAGDRQPGTAGLLAAAPQEQQQREAGVMSEGGVTLRQAVQHKAATLRCYQAELHAQLLLDASTHGVQGYSGTISSSRRWGMTPLVEQLGQAVQKRREQVAACSSRKRFLCQEALKWHQVGVEPTAHYLLHTWSLVQQVEAAQGSTSSRGNGRHTEPGPASPCQAPLQQLPSL